MGQENSSYSTSRHAKAIRRIGLLDITGTTKSAIEASINQRFGFDIDKCSHLLTKQVKEEVKNLSYCLNDSPSCMPQVELVIDKLVKDSYKRVIILGAQHGFGHAVSLPFVSHHRFGDPQTLIVVIYARQRHNPYVMPPIDGTEIVYVDVGLPGYNISLSAYVVIPSLLISIIAKRIGGDVQCFLAEEVYDSLIDRFNCESITGLRPTAPIELALFMEGCTSIQRRYSLTTQHCIDYYKRLFGSYSTTHLYVRHKGSLIRSCPSANHFSSVINAALEYTDLVLVSGDVSYSELSPSSRVIYLSTIPDGQRIQAIAALCSEFNISLGIGGGTQLPPSFAKSMLTISTYIGLAFPYSLSLPGKLATWVDAENEPLLTSSSALFERMNSHSEQSQLDLLQRGVIIPPNIQETIMACHEYFSQRRMPRKGYVHGRTFELTNSLTDDPAANLSVAYFADH
jgi:hypothetical protein